MCLSPINIINPNKYISTKYRDPYLLQVPCGHCAECQSQNSNAWLYRTSFEFDDCLNAGGFVYYDTLTYDEKHLPRLSEVNSLFPSVPCFRPSDVTNFFKRLRIRLSRAGFNVALRYFVSSEYGELRCRPHYHLLLFVYGQISPIVLSSLVAECWSLGRTDGIPFRTSAYVNTHNVINDKLPANLLRVSTYVTKYVQKNCKFQRMLDERIKSALDIMATRLYPDDPDVYLRSYNCSLLKRKLRVRVNQFHRQSLHFGESALQQIDLNSVFNDDVVYMQHYKAVVMPLPLPMYYKRKLFYDVVDFEGSKTWQLNDVGIEYREKRKKNLLQQLTNRFEAVCMLKGFNIDCSRLANYVYELRGRFNASKPESTLSVRFNELDYFNYITPSDRFHLGSVGVTPFYNGNVHIGYKSETLPPSLRIRDFIGKFVYLDPDREKELDKIYYELGQINKGKQRAYELKQHLTDVYKSLRVSL